MSTAREVHNFTGGWKAMQESFKASGDTLLEFLIPVFDKMNEKFQGADVNSYTNSIDNLTASFNRFVGEVFSGTSGVGTFVNSLADALDEIVEIRKGGRHN